MNPSRMRVIAIGRIRKDWIREGINQYLRRLPKLRINELNTSDPQKEAKAIQAQIKQGELLIALSEEGELLSSVHFAKRLQNLGSNKIAFVLGGADGLSKDIKTSAHQCISISPMTFPHEMARLLLVEQIYRASTILKEGPYHRN